MSGLNLRKRPRVCYYEPEEPPFDEYVYCAECGDYVYEYCSIHGPLLVIPDDKVVGAPPAGVPRAALTVPRVFLHLATSIIPGAGIGVFSSLALPSGVRFGPYRGARRLAAGDSDYGWQTELRYLRSSFFCDWEKPRMIFDKNHKPSHIVDAADDNRSNWMRYVNCARHCDEQNLVAYQYQGQLYYRTVKVIPRFSELLVFYGSEFARALGVDLRAYRTPCGCPYCEANEQNTEPTKENKRQTKNEEKPNEKKILKVSSAEKIQETSTPPQVISQNSDALHAPKKTKKNTCKRVSKKSPTEKVQNTLIDSRDNLQSVKATILSAKEKYTPEYSVHNQANLPKKVVTIPSFKSRKSAVKTSEKSEKATHFEVNLQKETVSNNTHTKETTNKAYLNINPTNFKCDKCHKKFDIKSDLQKHLHTHALIESSKSVYKDYVCKNCGNTFNTKLLLIEHRTTQHGIKNFACTECDYKTDNKTNFIKHQRTHTGEKPFNCNQCSRTFSQKSSLITHERIHTGHKPFNCNQCSRTFSQKSSLITHERIHTGHKPFNCNQCSRTFSQKSSLITHERTHSGEKPFKCDICDYRTNQTSHLKRHLMRIHSGQKPFSCDVCSYKCAVKADLNNHLKKH